MRTMLDALLSPRLLRPLFWLLAAFSLVMALLPAPPSLTTYDLGDKFNHILAFVVLTIVARLAWPRVRIWIPVLLLSLYGAAIEALQGIPTLHRDADLRDWVADSLAIALGVVIAQFLIYFCTKRDTI
jgi:VanZ family protein